MGREKVLLVSDEPTQYYMYVCQVSNEPVNRVEHLNKAKRRVNVGLTVIKWPETQLQTLMLLHISWMCK